MPYILNEKQHIKIKINERQVNIMSFSDLLKKPLPSKLANEKVMTESEKILDEIESSIVTENEGEDIINNKDSSIDTAIKGLAINEDSDEDEIIEDRDFDDDEEDLDDIDLSDLSDEELDEMEDELRDSDIDDVVGDVEPVELSADEEKEADDLMSLAGTTELLRSELNATEQAQFMESATDTQIAVFEGFLLESDVAESAEESEDGDVMTEAKFAPKTLVRFSAQSRKNQLYSVALLVSARAHDDPDFRKLQKVQKARRILKKRIQKKYHNEAIKRMKIYFARLRNSKSSILSNIGKKFSDKKD